MVNHRDKYDFLTLAGAFWLGLLFLGIILALAGFFRKEILWAYLFFSAAYFLYLATVSRIDLKTSRLTLLVSGASLAFIIFLSAQTSPTVFSGRDQGSFSEAAIRLSQNHQLEFSSPAEKEFFNIYGPGRALNFPGFSYLKNGNLITQFPLGYISWLAIWYSLFDLPGLVIANGITFFIFLVSFYLLVKKYLGTSAAIAAYFLTATSFVFSWFFKFTLSENLALALVWFGILQFYLFWQNRRPTHLGVSLAAFSLLAFTRIEAFSFLAAISICLFFDAKKRHQPFRDYFKISVIWPLLTIGASYLAALKINSPYYTAIAKGFLKSFSADSPATSPPLEIFQGPFYVLGVFTLYFLLAYLLIFFAAIFYLVRQKKYSLLLPLIIVLPSFFYLLHPGISSDHPWFLRRFVFSIIPVIIFYTAWFLRDFIKKPALRWAIFLFLFAGNLSVYLPFAAFSPDEKLLESTRSLSANFKSTDLVLVDREASGDGWAMISGPMNAIYGKQAVYFFNPNDLEKIDLEKFTGVFFIIPDKNFEFYRQNGLAEKLVFEKDYVIETTLLKSTSLDLPEKQKIFTQGKIYSYEF